MDYFNDMCFCGHERKYHAHNTGDCVISPLAECPNGCKRFRSVKMINVIVVAGTAIAVGSIVGIILLTFVELFGVCGG